MNNEMAISDFDRAESSNIRPDKEMWRERNLVRRSRESSCLLAVPENAGAVKWAKRRGGWLRLPWGSFDRALDHCSTH